MHDRPARLVSDNGPEFRALCLPKGVHPAFIQPGKPWQNGSIESFFDKLRDEKLRGAIFTSGAELQEALEEFQDHYDHHRPHRKFGLRSPAAFKRDLKTNNLEAETLTLYAGQLLGTSQLRREHLDVEVFVNVADAHVKTAIWRRWYNEVRPHSSLANQPPRAAAQGWNSGRAAPSLHSNLGVKPQSSLPEIAS
ncbi:MAG TPA: integrase core domain-containing protein [Fimbriimonadaceae bacterium]|nr:integrase core domain-containing protein [Fimbriimonadaceae bacterium]HRJ33635.1 integrase core domain-containing protein [Fimbriimonadaceae bacterium]